MRDPKSIDRLQGLHPKVRVPFQAFIEECENTLDITLRISQGLRTIAEQDALYAKGRSTAGPVVTNAKGGSSFHNYGLAIDLVEMVNGDTEVNWKYDMVNLRATAQKHGFEWGGSWIHLKDYPHFEMNFGYSWQQLFEKHTNGDVDENGYVNI